MSHTIAAVSTGSSISAIGIIRLSGDDCAKIAGSVFTPGNGRPLEDAPNRKLILGSLRDKEGRVITLEFDHFYMVTVYTPNSQNELARLSYRMEWEDAFRAYLKNLEKTKPVVVCGDLNVAHKEIDLKNPKTNRKNAGFTDEEREKFSILLESGFIDTFRYFYPEVEGIYSWWSYRFQSRAKNAGWRIDYFLISNSLESALKGAKIHTEILGSDHCPVECVLEF